MASLGPIMDTFLATSRGERWWATPASQNWSKQLFCGRSALDPTHEASAGVGVGVGGDRRQLRPQQLNGVCSFFALHPVSALPCVQKLFFLSFAFHALHFSALQKCRETQSVAANRRILLFWGGKRIAPRWDGHGGARSHDDTAPCLPGTPPLHREIHPHSVPIVPTNGTKIVFILHRVVTAHKENKENMIISIEKKISKKKNCFGFTLF